MATERQIAANRANSKKSTGPRTPEGKARARLNASRHLLTGQVHLLPDPERAAHNAFCEPFIAALNPANPVELQLARRIATDNWRLNRMTAIEDNILALGHDGPEGLIETEHPEIHSAVTAARVFQNHQADFQLITLYIQRTNREILRNMAMLRQLQAERRATRELALKEAAQIRQLTEMKRQTFDPARYATELALISGDPVPATHSAGSANRTIGSVFSNPEIDAWHNRHRRREELHLARNANWNLRKFRQAGGTLAA